MARGAVEVRSTAAEPAGSSRPRRRQIFALAPNSWHGPWMNRQQILSRLAQRGWPVSYSTGPLSLWDRGSDEWNAAPWFSSYMRDEGVCVEFPGRARLRWQRIAVFDRFILRQAAAALLNNAGASASDAIAYVFHPSLYDLAKALGCRWTVYHAYDIFSMQPGWSDELARIEKTLLDAADLVLASSASVAEALGRTARRSIRVLPNGADSHAFAAGRRLPCPADLAAIPRPRIAYVGRINRKVDFPMIASVARDRPQWHWVLVGPVTETGPGAPESDERIASAYRECRTLPNVHFLGAKPYSALPAYAGHMDVNTICYRRDRGWWNAAAPLKLHEYLATGRPVLSVDLRDIREFSGVVSFVGAADQWVGAIAAALNDRSEAASDARRRIAMANSWDERVSRIERLLDEMVGGADGDDCDGG